MFMHLIEIPVLSVNAPPNDKEQTAHMNLKV